MNILETWNNFKKEWIWRLFVKKIKGKIQLNVENEMSVLFKLLKKLTNKYFGWNFVLWSFLNISFDSKIFDTKNLLKF